MLSDQFYSSETALKIETPSGKIEEIRSIKIKSSRPPLGMGMRKGNGFTSN
jgi:hypothetical protein